MKLLLFVKVNSPDRRYTEKGYRRYFRFREGNFLVATFSHNNPSSATWSVYVKCVNQRTNDVTAISTKIKEQLRDPCPQRDRESENEEQAVIAAVNLTTERPLPYIRSFVACLSKNLLSSEIPVANSLFFDHDRSLL